MQDLGAQREVSSRGRDGLGASGEEGAQPAVTEGGQLSPPPQHTHTYRITPTEPLHFPCVLGKCKTGTEVLRKDKGGGRGRWPGFSPRHKGRLSGGGKTWAPEHTLLCACASEETAAVGRGQPGAARFPMSSARWGRNLSLAVCEALPQPAASSICQEKDLFNASLHKQGPLVPFRVPSS